MQRAKAYRIETERLVIRCYAPKDAILLKEAIDGSLDHLRPWMPWAHNEPEGLEAKIARLRKYRGQFDLGQDYVFGIFNKEESTLIGSTGLHTGPDERSREIGYWINAHHIRKGYALEAARALTRVGFEIEGLERIAIHCTPDNIRSQSIPQKMGYVHEATLRGRHSDHQGNKLDAMVWTMFKEDYFEAPFLEVGLKVFDVVGQEIEN